MRRLFAVIFLMLLLSGCKTDQTQTPEIAETQPAAVATETVICAETEPETIPVTVPETIPETEPETVPETEPPVHLEIRSADAVVDYTYTQDGYITVCYTGQTEQRLKFRLTGPTTTYTYNLPLNQWSVFPLSDGNGSYQASVYINTAGSKYALVMTGEFEVELSDEFAPFLRPNQYVDYADAVNTVKKSAELCGGLKDPLEKVAAVYDFTVGTLSYDYERAATVKSGYLPVLDDVLAQGKGICFDYASLMAAMLRAQGVPCKLVVGYVGEIYHAWISVWTEETGWIDGAIFFDGNTWKRMDPTFASSGGRSDEIMDFIKNETYTVKYLY